MSFIQTYQNCKSRISRPVRLPSKVRAKKQKKIRLIMPNSINHIIQIHYLYLWFSKYSLFGSSTTGALQNQFEYQMAEGAGWS